MAGWGVREDLLVKRTIIQVFLTLGAASAKIYGTIEGAELYGALGWGSVFAVAGTMTGLGFAWAADV